jgi:hypothetical protein
VVEGLADSKQMERELRVGGHAREDRAVPSARKGTGTPRIRSLSKLQKLLPVRYHFDKLLGRLDEQRLTEESHAKHKGGGAAKHPCGSESESECWRYNKGACDLEPGEGVGIRCGRRHCAGAS